jgi:hypothetical protein
MSLIEFFICICINSQKIYICTYVFVKKNRSAVQLSLMRDDVLPPPPAVDLFMDSISPLVHVYMNIYIYIYIYIYMHIYVYIYIDIHIFMYIYIYMRCTDGQLTFEWDWIKLECLHSIIQESILFHMISSLLYESQ